MWNVLTADTFVTNGLRQYLAVQVIFNIPQQYCVDVE